MTSEEVIRKGKDFLLEKGIVESECASADGCVEPTVPGLGGMGDRITFSRNRQALARYYIQTRLIGDHFSPDSSTELFGRNIKFPILSAPMSGIKSNLRGHVDEKDFMDSIIKGCKDAGTIGVGGDSFDTTSNYVIPDLIRKHGGIGVCKPRNFEALKERILELKKANPIAIGVDIDGMARMLINTTAVTRKNMEELRTIRALFDGPMFLKGILSVEDAVAAHKAGFDAIVISNHGGRTIDYALGTADVLPAIAKKLKGKMKILVDGGVKNGFDVFVYLALGADAVLVGRSVLYAAVGGGSEGVKTVLDKFAADLRVAMLYADCPTLKDVRKNMLGIYET